MPPNWLAAIDCGRQAQAFGCQTKHSVTPRTTIKASVPPARASARQQTPRTSSQAMHSRTRVYAESEHVQVLVIHTGNVSSVLHLRTQSTSGQKNARSGKSNNPREPFFYLPLSFATHHGGQPRSQLGVNIEAVQRLRSVFVYPEHLLPRGANKLRCCVFGRWLERSIPCCADDRSLPSPLH